MKWSILLAALSVAQAGDVARPELADIKTVYLLPMSNALDQFLAIRLTRGGVVQVVTDPKLADAILSDYIGTSLEEKLNALYGAKKAVEPANKEDKDKDKQQPPAFGTPMTGGSRSKGAIFLVDRNTRTVLWSDYVRPKSGQPDELNHVADKIAGRFEKDKRGK
jgi:hypothetical protein